MNILVAGGAGYIGSHTCVSLLEAGHSVIIIDNFSNSDVDMVKKVREITGIDIETYNMDATDEIGVESVFAKHRIDGVIHFAGLKAVGESVYQPITYYYNNLVSTLVLLRSCQKYGVKRFIFSSSATVYGNNIVPFVETLNLQPTTNPYGESKAISERILSDIAKTDPTMSIAILRYFNPIGAHESGMIGDKSKAIPNNILPYITLVARGRLEKLKVFGDDYPTADGTGVRDYIHVMDLAEGHVAVLEKLVEGVNIYNFGTGQGISVFELLEAFEEATGVKIPYEVIARRPGDIATCYADVTKAEQELGWKASRDIYTMCRDAWRFEKNQMRLSLEEK